MTEEDTSPPHIGTLTEKSLHAAIKDYLAKTGDQFEVKVDGSVIDIVRGELLIEIQTRNFFAMKKKLEKLLGNGYRIHLVHPIPEQKWIIRESGTGAFVSKRKSPKTGRVVDAAREMLRIPEILLHPNLTLEVLLTHQEEIWRDDGQGSWRRKGWSRHDNRLLGVSGSMVFKSPRDYLNLLPEDLPRPFTNSELAKALKIRKDLASKITYTLRKMALLEIVGKQGNSNLMTTNDP